MDLAEKASWELASGFDTLLKEAAAQFFMMTYECVTACYLFHAYQVPYTPKIPYLF
jgi:hypothetical protein